MDNGLGLTVHLSVPRVVLQPASSGLGRALASSALRLEATAEPVLPEGWVAVRPILSGVSGSDLALL